MTTLHVDFETRSTADLKKVGTYNYARHPDTDIWCMAYAFGDDEVLLWRPGSCDIERIRDHIADGGIVTAHNAAFELAIWNHVCVPRYGWPPLKVEQVRCTMAMAYAMALPGSLEMAAAAVGLEVAKDMKGHRLMLQMAKPRRIDPDGTIVWWDDADRRQRLYEYCKTDVEVERQLEKRIFALSGAEQKLWQLDRTINDRGVYVDRYAIAGAVDVVAQEKERLDAKMREVTAGYVPGCSKLVDLTDWLTLLGVPVNGLGKDKVKELLAREDLPASARKALTLRQEAGKTSTAKLTTMENGAAEDNRVRDMFQYHGAGTGRWAGRRLQLQNLPRPKLKQPEIEDAISYLVRADRNMIDVLYGPPLDVISSCIRGIITAAPGNDLIAGDFSNVEGRVLSWLAGEEWKLQAFRDYDTVIGHDENGKPIRKGPDTYLVTASHILGISPDEARPYRQEFGKVPDLALGYQGGVGAFDSMAVIYGVNMEEHYDTVVAVAPAEHVEQAQDAYQQRGEGSFYRWVASEVVKLGWRARHPNIEGFWPAIEDAAHAAVRNPGRIYQCGAQAIKFRMSGSFLWCQLPSGRVLCYPYPRLEEKTMPWGKKKETLIYKSMDIARRWVDTKTYGGKLAENVTQAVARDLLAAAMFRVEAAGYPIVMHVHDEIVSEVKAEFGSVDKFGRLMSELPDWAVGLPIATECWRGRRYRK